jgi:large subunit ribosomal protein L3
MNGLLARKVGMSRVFLPTGEAVAVTYLKIDENQVVRTKTKEKDGYEAVVLGVGAHTMKTRKGKELTKFKGQKEFKVQTLDGVAIGNKVDASVIPADSMVTIVSTSKGKGFQGVVKRYHFSGGPRTHGSHFKREPGSIGMRTWPGRVHPGKRMAGRMGNDRITLKNRPVVAMDEKEGLIAIKGPIPGPNGSLVTVIVETSAAKK